jgi:hypothetical protein
VASSSVATNKINIRTICGISMAAVQIRAGEMVPRG